MAGSGVLWKMIFGFLGFSTESDADHDVSPLSELAVQVYNPVSSVFKSEMVNSHSFYSFSLIFVTYRVLILVLLKNVFSIIMQCFFFITQSKYLNSILGLRDVSKGKFLV